MTIPDILKIFMAKNDTSMCLYLPASLRDILNVIPEKEGFKNRNEFIKWAIVNQLSLLEKTKNDFKGMEQNE